MEFFRRSLVGIALGGIFLGTLGSVHAQAVIPSFVSPANLAGTQTWAFSLGTFFSLTGNIAIGEMGVFDDLGNGIRGPLEVAIFTQAGSQVAGTYTSFDSTSQGTLSAGSYRFKSLASAVILTPGNYAVIARGFSNADPNYNSHGGPSSITTNFYTGSITWGNTYYNNSDAGLVLPGILDTTPDRYGAGAFGAVIPEPGTLALLSLGLAPIAVAMRRRRK